MGIVGAYLIHPTRHEDARGIFNRTFCKAEFEAAGLEPTVEQANASYSNQAGTLRGLHFQFPPAAETKVVRCARGALFDVVVDLRPDSPTHRQWFGAELTASNRDMVYVPAGCGHGFLTLEPHTEAEYLVSASYASELESGVRYDDSAFGIDWPRDVKVVSSRDARWPDYEPDDRLTGLLPGLPGART
jgi:dTDP-4-dehydrorhamnose 3,5-epimerase